VIRALSCHRGRRTQSRSFPLLAAFVVAGAASLSVSRLPAAEQDGSGGQEIAAVDAPVETARELRVRLERALDK
jgi:hypothetical protein